MEKFIKENWFKIGVLIVFAFFVYKGIAPVGSKNLIEKNNTSDAKSLELAKQCKTDSQKNFQEDMDSATREKYKSGVKDCFYFPPQYSFNKELNTCLYYGGYTCDLTKTHTDGLFKGMPITRWSKHITDIYTNKSLTDVYVDDSSDVSDWNMKMIYDFNDKAKELGF